LAGISLEAGKIIKKASILAGQLKKISLSLVIVKKEKAVMAFKIKCTICRLIISRV
jgi:hypothetical protein